MPTPGDTQVSMRRVTSRPTCSVSAPPPGNDGPDPGPEPFSLLSDLSIPRSSPSSPGPITSATRFLSPETWVIDKRPFFMENMVPFDSKVLKRHISLNQRWLEQWVSSGSNPFIHSRLYRAQFPSCIQIAYVTLSSYINRSEANTDTILRIMQDRADELLRDNGLAWNDISWESSTSANPVNILQQLARVHALMVYQVVSLFDGDIRSRHVAESRQFILTSWATQLVESASQVFSQSLSVSDQLDTAVLHLTGSKIWTNNLESSWNAWILAESVRRTWLVAMSIYTGYFLMQKGWTMCPGGVMLTNGRGLWEASSAFEFDKLCAEGDMRFMQRFDAERIFSEARPSDIDEFGKFNLEMTFGSEKMNQWML